MAGQGNPLGRVLLPVKALPHQVNVVTDVDLTDDAGGRIPLAPGAGNGNVKAAGLRCWVQTLSADQQQEFARLDMVGDVKVTFFQDPQVENEDVLQFGGRNLIVTGVKNADEVNLVWVVVCRTIGKNG